MGVGGGFWDLLKPYARTEDFDFLRDKKVAVDLSFWIVQHETAVKGNARNPHLRITFFRTINLFSKELLELLGIPILRARCEAEALCAQLNSEGHVDACITADSDAFLYGAKCVIKCLRSNSKEPFECYHMSDIEAGLGLKRKQLIAISLLVGNDHDLQGVPGIGLDTAVRFVQLFSEDEILNRLHDVGKGDTLVLQTCLKSITDGRTTTLGDSSIKTRSPHCSNCGHPGSKRAHLKLACEYCNVYGNENCTEKPVGFKCECSTCDKDRRNKEQKKHENWQIRVCQKIATEQSFPNNEIIEMYLCHNHGNFSESDGPSLLWENPKIETLVDFLAYHQHWEPSYIRQRILPMLSTIFFREMASNPKEGSLLCGQYEFHSVQRVKVRYGHQFYLVKWNKASPNMSDVIHSIPTEQCDFQQSESLGVNESIDLLDEPDVPQILVDNGCWFLLTDENMALVQAAYPKNVDVFLQEKALKESKSRRKSSLGSSEKCESPKSSGIQLSITEFYRSTKVLIQAKHGEDPAKDSDNCAEASPIKSRKTSTRSTPTFSKSVRRRLLFD
ncbi:5'-3' exonuclease family protein isoform X2 [Tasmannia lanceolata]|uniref:5'-3' exonuclease family protein isoform X2 n=1 Tax=Tasmannia lanceolata TaxID=3420 RepID=UPI004062F827